MKCPKCGSELKKSRKDPDILVCYNCKVRYKNANKPISNDNSKSKKPKKNKGCLKIFLIVFAVFVVITAISSMTGGESKKPDKNTKDNEHQEETNKIDDVSKEDCILQFENQKNALDDLISRYESGEESAGTTAERLDGLADGIQNTINSLNGKEGSEDAVSYGTTLKGIATHYARYLQTGDQSEMDDVNTLRETIE